MPGAANMMAAGITLDGKLVAVGANELMVRADFKSGRVIATSEVGRVSVKVPEHAPVSRVIPLNPSGETVLDLLLQAESLVLPDAP